MGRTHSSQFADDKVAAEALRVFQLAVSRWYGEDTPPVVEYEKLSIDELIWGNQHPDPGPMSIEDSIVLRNNSKSKAAAKRRNLALVFWRECGAASHITLKSSYPQLRKPKISCLGESVTATWGVGSLYISITTLGETDCFIVIEKESEVLLEEDFKISRLSNILKVALDFQKVNRRD